MLDSLPARLAVLNRDGVIIAINRAWERFDADIGGGSIRISGVGSNYVEAGLAEHVPFTNEAAPVAQGLKDVLAGRHSEFRLEYQYRGARQERWFLLTITPLRGGFDGAVVSHVNIAPRVRSEQAMAVLLAQIEQQRRQLDDLIADVPGMVWEWYPAAGADGSGREAPEPRGTNFASRYVKSIFGYTAEEWLAMPDFGLPTVHPDDRDRVMSEWKALLASGIGGGHEYRCLRKDGRVVWVHNRATVVLDASGQAVGLRGVATDITERRLYEEVLRQRAGELSRLAWELKTRNEELDQFAYVTSHDLKAPLRGIANLSQWIEEDIGKLFPPEAHQQMNLLRGRVHRMEAMIDGLLQYSRIGRVKARSEWVDVAALVDEVVDLLSPPEGFRVEVVGRLPSVSADRLRLQQVFQNLIGNAVKHHIGPGGIARVSAADRGDRWEFAVADDGPGIEPRYHEKIFVIFQTLEARDKIEGTGIGLSLVKKIVENVGGTISVDSEAGRGATFRFTWPKAPADA